MNNRIPLTGTFELTARCNMQCNMCYVRVDGQTIKESGKRERTTEEWIQMAEEAARAGTLYLLLTGGEVTIRPDFCEIYEAIAKMGFITTVYTNATNITDKVMRIFEKYPPQIIGVTMYGASPDTYYSICGYADGYDRFVDGLRMLKKLPSLIRTRTTLVKKNVNDYQAMKSFILQEMGQDQILSVSSTVFNASRGGLGHPIEERLDPQEHCNFFYSNLDMIYRLIKDEKISLSEFQSSKPFTELKQVLERHGLVSDGGYLFQNCHAGINEYFISWSGDMYACGLLPRGYTRPFEEGFLQAWEHLPEQYPRTKVAEKCKNCDLQVYCESCPAFRILETGDWNNAPSFSCDLAKLLKDKLELLLIKET